MMSYIFPRIGFVVICQTWRPVHFNLSSGDDDNSDSDDDDRDICDMLYIYYKDDGSNVSVNNGGNYDN